MKKGSKKSLKKSQKKPKTIKTILTVLIEGTQQFALDIPADANGVINEDVFSQQEEQILSEIQKLFPSLNVQTVDVDCSE